MRDGEDEKSELQIFWETWMVRPSRELTWTFGAVQLTFDGDHGLGQGPWNLGQVSGCVTRHSEQIVLTQPTQSLYSVLFVTMPLASRPIQPMTSASVSDPGWCQGCTTLFSQSGLSKHLSQTHKTSCLAFRSLRNAALLVARPSENSGLPPPGMAMDLDSTASLPQALAVADVDMDADPVPFEGDFFGDYPADFFDDPEDEGPEPSDYSSDEESAPEDGGWEPPLASSVHASPGTANAATETSTQGPSLPSAERRAAVEKTASRKTFVISYPSPHAGRPIPNVVPTSPAHAIYRHALEHGVDNSSTVNVYYPFASRMEWSVAKWAKMRGPGSTSFSELLAIEEVCMFPLWHCSSTDDILHALSGSRTLGTIIQELSWFEPHHRQEPASCASSIPTRGTCRCE